jgi:hypothetical protein
LYMRCTSFALKPVLMIVFALTLFSTLIVFVLQLAFFGFPFGYINIHDVPLAIQWPLLSPLYFTFRSSLDSRLHITKQVEWLHFCCWCNSMVNSGISAPQLVRRLVHVNGPCGCLSRSSIETSFLPTAFAYVVCRIFVLDALAQLRLGCGDFIKLGDSNFTSCLTYFPPFYDKCYGAAISHCCITPPPLLPPFRFFD